MTYAVSQKQYSALLPVTSPNANRFPRFVKCEAISDDKFIVNLPASPSVIEVSKSVNIWRSYTQECGVLFLTHSVDGIIGHQRSFGSRVTCVVQTHAQMHKRSIALRGP